MVAHLRLELIENHHPLDCYAAPLNFSSKKKRRML